MSYSTKELRKKQIIAAISELPSKQIDDLWCDVFYMINRLGVKRFLVVAKATKKIVDALEVKP